MILKALRRVGETALLNQVVEMTLIGGAAGMLSSEFTSERVTQDCDIISLIPIDAMKEINDAAVKVAQEFDLNDHWLNAKAMQLNVLPDGWESRRIPINTFGNLEIFSLGRIDLMCTKFYAGSTRDREDIETMNPTKEELEFVKNYLYFMKVPSREANPDQIEKALYYIDSFE